MSMDSCTIRGRSSACPTSNISRSLPSPPGPMPTTSRPPEGERVELGRVRGHRGGMCLGQVEHAGAEPDLPGPRDDGGEEDERRGDALAPGAEVLADIGLGEPELIGQDQRLLILGED